MKLLVVGMGSIGRRHARLARELGWNVSVVSQHPTEYPHHATIGEALQENPPDAIIIAKPTAEHFQVIREIEAQAAGISILVEKPLFDRALDFVSTKNRYFVAYNLRFHPVYQRIQELLQNSAVLYAQVTVGSYLPSWRPERDYRSSYSAHRAQGGGVVLDLSHEIDCLMNWFGDDWNVVSLSENTKSLEIDSDDLCMALLRRDGGPRVFLHMDYLSRLPFRRGIIQCGDKTIFYDFVRPSVQVSGQPEETFSVERDDTYRAQLQALAHQDPSLCSLEQGHAIMRLADELQKQSHSFST